MFVVSLSFSVFLFLCRLFHCQFYVVPSLYGIGAGGGTFFPGSLAAIMQQSKFILLPELRSPKSSCAPNRFNVVSSGQTRQFQFQFSLFISLQWNRQEESITFRR